MSIGTRAGARQLSKRVTELESPAEGLQLGDRTKFQRGGGDHDSHMLSAWGKLIQVLRKSAGPAP